MKLEEIEDDNEDNIPDKYSFRVRVNVKPEPLFGSTLSYLELLSFSAQYLEHLLSGDVFKLVKFKHLIRD